MDKLQRTRLKTPKPRPIARKRHNYIYLLLAILFAISTIYIVKIYPPSHEIPIMNIGIPILPIFFISLAGLIFNFLTFIFIKKTQGLLVSFFVILYLILRFFGLTNWVFGVITLAFFISSEIIVLKKFR